MTAAISICWWMRCRAPFGLGGLQAELEELLGVSVDVLMPGDLPAKFRDPVLAEARQL